MSGLVSRYFDALVAFYEAGALEGDDAFTRLAQAAGIQIATPDQVSAATGYACHPDGSLVIVAGSPVISHYSQEDTPVDMPPTIKESIAVKLRQGCQAPRAIGWPAAAGIIHGYDAAQSAAGFIKMPVAHAVPPAGIVGQVIGVCCEPDGPVVVQIGVAEPCYSHPGGTIDLTSGDYQSSQAKAAQAAAHALASVTAMAEMTEILDECAQATAAYAVLGDAAINRVTELRSLTDRLDALLDQVDEAYTQIVGAVFACGG